MTAPIFGLAAAALIAIGVFGFVAGADALRRIVAFNVLGAGVFLLFGIVARRGGGAGFGGDPVPQALVITGIVVAFSATALAIALLKRLAEAQRDEAAVADSGTGPGSGAAAPPSRGAAASAQGEARP